MIQHTFQKICDPKLIRCLKSQSFVELLMEFIYKTYLNIA